VNRLIFGPDASKALRGMNAAQRTAALNRFKLFQFSPEVPGLNFEKLGGFANLYSIRLSRSHRAILRKVADEQGVLFEVVKIGPHDIYRRP